MLVVVILLTSLLIFTIPEQFKNHCAGIGGERIYTASTGRKKIDSRMFYHELTPVFSQLLTYKR